MSDSLGRDSLATRMARPFYESMLDIATGGRGYLRRVNGRGGVLHRRRGIGRTSRTSTNLRSASTFATACGQSDICLNIGANVGIYTLLLTKWSAPSGRVYSFEPNPKVRAILLDNIRRNGFSDRVSVSEHAVGGERGEATFFADGMKAQGLGSSRPISSRIGCRGHEFYRARNDDR